MTLAMDGFAPMTPYAPGGELPAAGSGITFVFQGPVHMHIHAPKVPGGQSRLEITSGDDDYLDDKDDIEEPPARTHIPAADMIAREGGWLPPARRFSFRRNRGE